MALLTNLTIVLALACISQQLMVANCHKNHGRKGRTEDKGKVRDRGQNDDQQPKLPVPSAEKNDRRPKSPVKGKFDAKDKSQCTWVATGDDVFVLGVTCRKGSKSFNCEYVATPAVCPQYTSNANLYWKQISRALRKQKKLCQDTTALVRAGMCRKAPKEAHFKLNKNPSRISTPSPLPPAGLKSCNKVDNEKLAGEYCNGSWSSFCTFFFTIVQTSDDC